MGSLSKRAHLQEELDDLAEEEAREQNFATQTTSALSDSATGEDGVAAVNKHWTPGWLQHLDSRIRPVEVSRRLIRDLVVMSFHLSLVDANGGLVSRVGRRNRAFTAADVKDVCTRQMGRSWDELKREALGTAQVAED